MMTLKYLGILFPYSIAMYYLPIIECAKVREFSIIVAGNNEFMDYGYTHPDLLVQ